MGETFDVRSRVRVSNVLLRLREAVHIGMIRLKWRVYQYAEKHGLHRRTPGLVSVLVPTLEERHQLLETRCLSSIASQTYSNFEVLVVSEHFSEDVQRTVQQFDSRFRYIWGAKKSHRLRMAGPLAVWCSGAAPSLNLAMRKSRGTFIARLDDDDSWMPHHLAVGLNLLQSQRADFYSCNALDPSGALVGINDLGSSDFGEELKWCRPNVRAGTPITWIFRSTLRSFEFNEESWKKKWNKPVDYDFLLRTGAAGVKMIFSDNVTAKYMARPGLGGLTGFKAYLKEHETDQL